MAASMCRHHTDYTSNAVPVKAYTPFHASPSPHTIVQNNSDIGRSSPPGQGLLAAALGAPGPLRGGGYAGAGGAWQM